MMSPQQMPVVLQPSSITQKVQLIYKLSLLESARNTLEQDLRDFTKQASKEVHSVLNSSLPASVFSNLAKALDVKHQQIVKLSALLKGITVESQVSVQSAVTDGVGSNHLKPLSVKGIMMTDVLKFGPMLKNSLMASSIARAVQVLGAALSHQKPNLFLKPQSSVVQQDDMSDSISPNFNHTTLITSTPCHLKAEQGVFEENSQPVSVCVPPAITQSHKINEERPQILLPPLQAIFPVISNAKPLIIWGCDDDNQVQHQKQTSSQLLHFLRAKATNKGALEVTVLEWAKSIYEANDSDSAKRMSPTIKTQSHQFRHVVTNDLINAMAPTNLHANMENQAPVFRVKRVKSNGSLIYSCVIASKTELWDIGDIFTEVLQEDCKHTALEAKDSKNKLTQVEDSSVNIDQKTQMLQFRESESVNNFDSEILTPDSVNIPEFQFQRFEETEIVVTHIASPGNFYIQHANSLEELQALGTYCKASHSYAEQNCIPDIGTHVIGWFPQKDQWCRAQVMRICGVSKDNNARNGASCETSIKVEVKRLDYGDTACLSLCDIKKLLPEMAVLPLQALQVSLTNVTPINGRDWSEQAVGWFKAMVHNRTLYARLYPQGPTISVELFLEKGKLGAMRRGASLSLRLAQNGHAKHNKLKNAGLMKKSTVQIIARKQESDWEKYLISCYTQIKK